MACQSMHAKYTKIQSGETVIPHTVKANLTPSLGRRFVVQLG